MRSQWYEFKDAAVSLRKEGQSLKTIHRNLGVPLSTLSGWLKNIEMSQDHQSRLRQNKAESWERAHQKAADWHRAQKALRKLTAKQEAKKALDRLQPNSDMLDLSLAMLLFGNNTRTESSPISSSNPSTLRFVLSVLYKNYGLAPESVRCELNLRSDQDASTLKEFWSKELKIRPSQFKSTHIDKRTVGKPTDNTYKGVCIISFSSVAIQRKLMYLYTLFCERIADVNLGT